MYRPRCLVFCRSLALNIFLIVIWPSYLTASSCSDSFVYWRSEVETAHDYNLREGGDLRFYSALRGMEHLDIEYDPRFLGAGHILSFGSGPDIYRALHDFPWATDMHFIEGTKWDKNLGVLFTELDARIASLNCLGCKTEFTPGVWANVLQTQSDLFDLPGHGIQRIGEKSEPAKWTIQLGQGQFAKQITIWLHLTDQDDPVVLARDLDFIPDHGVSGILITNSFPPKDAGAFALRRLTANGAYLVYEYNASNQNPHVLPDWIKALQQNSVHPPRFSQVQLQQRNGKERRNTVSVLRFP